MNSKFSLLIIAMICVLPLVAHADDEQCSAQNRPTTVVCVSEQCTFDPQNLVHIAGIGTSPSRA